MRRSPMNLAIFGLVAALAVPSCARAGDWVMADTNRCKAWNPSPVSNETLKWDGSCVNGLAEGQGVLTWYRGGKAFERDEGQWIAGQQSGSGVQTWPGGEFRGALREGLPQGEGVMKLGSMQYRGAFQGGKPNGFGVLTASAGTFEGEWREGCLAGKRRASFGVTLQTCP